MNEQQIQERLHQQDEIWNGPRFIFLLIGFLLCALVLIYTCASYRSTGFDFSWQGNGLAHDPKREAKISNW